MEEYNELKIKIKNMNLSLSFRSSIEDFIEAVESKNKFRIWDLQDTIYTSVKLENLDSEEIDLIKKFIFLDIINDWSVANDWFIWIWTKN